MANHVQSWKILIRGYSLIITSTAGSFEFKVKAKDINFPKSQLSKKPVHLRCLIVLEHVLGWQGMRALRVNILVNFGQFKTETALNGM